MKITFKRLGALLAILAITGSFAGCAVPKSDILDTNTNKIKDYAQYTYTTKLIAKDKSEVVYDTVYTITKGEQDGKKIVTVNNHAKNATQLLDATSILLGETTDNASPLMPISINMLFEDMDKPKTNTYINVSHNFQDQKSNIKIKQYANETDEQTTEKTYNVTTAPQYFDSDTLPYVIASLPLAVNYEKNFMMSSSNRDALQSMNVRIAEEKEIEVPAGRFNCYVAVIKPNTSFTSTVSYMYFAKDYDNMLIMIAQTEETSFQLKSFSFEKPQA